MAISRQASTEPKIRSRSSRMVSCSLSAARIEARLTASVVQPTPPMAPVTVMIRGAWLAVDLRFGPAASQLRDDLEQLGWFGGQREKLASAGADRLQDQGAVGRAAGGQHVFAAVLSPVFGSARRPGPDRGRGRRSSGGRRCLRRVARLPHSLSGLPRARATDSAQQPLQGSPRLLDGIDQDDSDQILHCARLGLNLGDGSDLGIGG